MVSWAPTSSAPRGNLGGWAAAAAGEPTSEVAHANLCYIFRPIFCVEKVKVIGVDMTRLSAYISQCHSATARDPTSEDAHHRWAIFFPHIDLF